MPHLRPFGLALGVILAAAGVGAAQQKIDSFGDVLPKCATVRLGTTRGIVGRQDFIALPPDYARLAFVLRDKSGVEILSVATGGTVSIFDFEKPPKSGLVLAASADGKRLLTWEDGVLLVRETVAGRVVRRLPAPVAPRLPGYRDQHLASLSADGKLVASGGAPPRNKGDKQPETAVTVWDVDRDQQVVRVPVPESHTHVALLSPDGKLVAGWSLFGGPVLKLPQPGEQVGLGVWEVATGKLLTQLVPPEKMSLQSVAFSPNGEFVACGYADGRVELFESRTGRRKTAAEGTPGVAWKVAVAPDNKTVAGVSVQGAVTRWATTNGKLLGTTTPEFSVSRTLGLAFADAERVVAWGPVGDSFGVWEAPSGKLLSPLSANLSPVTSIGFRDSGREIVTLSNGGVVRWDAATGKPLGPLMRPQSGKERAGLFYFGRAHISPDGARGFGLAGSRNPDQHGPARLAAFDPFTARGGAEWLAPWSFAGPLTAVWNADATRAVLFQNAIVNPLPGAKCVVWDPAANKIVADTMLVLPGRFGDETEVAVSPDGTRLMTAIHVRPPGMPAARPVTVFNLWDLQTGKELGRITQEPSQSRLHMTAVNNTTAVFTGRGIQKVDFGTGTVTSATAEPVRFGIDIAPVFNADRTLFAAADLAKSGEPSTSVVRVYDWPSGKVRHSFAGHANVITALAFSPDGKTLASASNDNTVLLWELKPK